MNYLGHAFLTPQITDLLIGNFLGDHVKGKLKGKYPEYIQEGIKLHRFIDTFTDSHEIVRAHCNIMEPKLGHLAGVAMDMIYDHVLVTNWEHFSDQPVETFIQSTYEEIQSYSDYFPPKFELMFSYMRRDNWLLEYGNEAGMLKALNGLSHKIKNKIKLENDLPVCWDVYQEHKTEITEGFKLFVKDIQIEIAKQFS